MSTFTERGASSSSINLMNSSTRFPEGEGMQKPRIGSDRSAGLSAAARLKVPASSRLSHVFARIDFWIMFNTSNSARLFRPAACPSGRADQLRGGRLGRFRRVFRLDDL